MTTTTLSPATRSTEAASRIPGMKVTQVRLILSEWTKFKSLRSTNITLLVIVVLTVGMGALITGVIASQWSTAPAEVRAGFNPTFMSLSGVSIAQLAVGVLGVLLLSGEYATGMIKASLTAAPRRLPVLWAKLAVFGGVVGVVSVVSTFAAFFLGQSLLSGQGISASISDPDALRMVLGSAGYLVLVGVIGMALGGLLRNTAAGISSLVALFFVIPPLMSLLPSGWGDTIGPYLPSNAGTAFWGQAMGATTLSPAAGFAVLCGWAAVAVAAAAITLKRRDA